MAGNASGDTVTVGSLLAIVWRPLTRAATLRRCAHLLVGGALALGLALPLLAAVEFAPLALLSPLALVAAAALPGVRRLERAQANALLATALPTASLGGERTERRRFTPGVAGWLALRAVVGGVASLLLVLGVAAAVVSVIAPFDEGFFEWPSWRSPGGWEAAWMPAAGALALLGAVHVADGLGAVEARAAARLLGATPDEELALLRTRTEALAERERIARELHDSVGHAVTVTLLQATAARRVLDRDPDAAREALATIETVSRTTMEELDRVLALLRREAGELDSEPTGDLDALADGLRAAGLPFALEHDPSVKHLPAPVRAAAYRIVQEAATNVLRHAGPVPTRAEVAVRDGLVELSVHNARGARPAGSAVNGTGRGLRGVRERARVLGGEASFGPAADGGWTVRATLPRGAPT